MASEAQTETTMRLPIEVLISPFVRFARIEAAAGILLMAGMIAALVWANSPWERSYHTIWDAPLAIGFGKFALTESRHDWINDGLMAVFFFVVGLEIKREMLIGELSSLRRAAFPLIAAMGGAGLPALIYTAIAREGAAREGWGIPMATDIAFVLGVLAILGSRVPVSLKVFVTALAIADDLIAVLVIALFYTERIHVVSLELSLVGIGLSLGVNWLGIRKPIVYGAIGVFVWFAMMESGIHATVAGVLLAFTIPARTYIDRDSFLNDSRTLLDRFKAAEEHSADAHLAIHSMHTKLELIESPLHHIEHVLHPWVSFLIMPLFAFANSGVRILGNVAEAARHPATLGIVIGLFVGKPLGIWVFARLSAMLRLTSPPAELSWKALFGAAWLCGLGFTMSLFIATLAFGEGRMLDMAKIGILAGSLVSCICGSVYLMTQRDGAEVLG
jgi:Na+:H+ antiporter, NhaA family